MTTTFTSAATSGARVAYTSPEIAERASVVVLASYLTRRHSGVAQATISIINEMQQRGDLQVHVYAFEVEDGVLHSDVNITLLPTIPSRRGVWRIGRVFAVADHVRVLAAVSLPDASLVYTQSLEFALAFRKLDKSTPVVTHLGHVLADREVMEDKALPMPWRAIDAVLAKRNERKLYKVRNARHLVSTNLVADARADSFKTSSADFPVQPLGIDIARFSRAHDREAVRQRLGIGEADRLIVSVARFVPWKNLDWLVRAMESLPSHCHLVLVGAGECRESLESSANLIAPGRVHFTGHTDPVPYLAAADVFALPSSIESFGMAYAEAMCAGLPCVGLRYLPPVTLSSAQEVIEQDVSGLLVSDENELVIALRELVTNDMLRIRMKRAAQARATSRFNAATYAQEVASLVASARNDSPVRQAPLARAIAT